MIFIDGAYGEGGGQVLRTSLALAALTGQAVRIERIRAGRRRPGLAAQHLTAVWAAAALCDATLHGDEFGSQALIFQPNHPVRAGDYTFDVSEARQGGSAGAVSLVLQTVLLPLALVDGESQLILRGGTHVPWSPPFHYLDQVYLPTLARLGLEAKVELKKWGFYPAGGGEIIATVRGRSRERGLEPIDWAERGPLQRIWGTAAVSNLPAHIPQRMANRARNLLAQEGLEADVQAQRVRTTGPGAGIFLLAEYQAGLRAGFSAYGRKGLPAERVAEAVCRELLTFQAGDASIDLHLADQLLAPLAWACGESRFVAQAVSQHLTTNAWVIELFGRARVRIDSESCTVVVRPADRTL